MSNLLLLSIDFVDDFDSCREWCGVEENAVRRRASLGVFLRRRAEDDVVVLGCEGTPVSLGREKLICSGLTFACAGLLGGFSGAGLSRIVENLWVGLVLITATSNGTQRPHPHFPYSPQDCRSSQIPIRSTKKLLKIRPFYVYQRPIPRYSSASTVKQSVEIAIFRVERARDHFQTNRPLFSL